MTWIQQELQRTRLPKSSLAGYLGLDNAAVTRLASGDRQITTSETLSAGGFFSVVPSDVDEEHLSAIERLRATRLRRTIGLQLVRWFADRAAIDPLAASFGRLLAAVEADEVTLRADQIAAICRALSISLPSLVCGEGIFVCPNDENKPAPQRSNDALEFLRSCAVHWAGEGHGIFEYGFELALTDGSKLSKVTLRSTDASPFEFLRCRSCLIENDRAEPMFSMGQTIFVSDLEPHTGDRVLVTIDLDAGGGAAAGVIGRFVHQTAEHIALLTPKGKRTQLDKSKSKGIHRIEFCKF